MVEVYGLPKTRSFVVLGRNGGILLGYGFREQTDTARKTGGRKDHVLKSSHKLIVSSRNGGAHGWHASSHDVASTGQCKVRKRLPTAGTPQAR